MTATTSTTPLTTTKDLWAALRGRRTYYALAKQSPVSDGRIQEIITTAVTHTPSAFNSQSTRVVLLLGHEHDKLWDITTDVLRGIVPEDQFQPTQQRMNGFKGAYGTVLFFEDQQVVTTLQEQFALYQDRFPVWAQHTNAMHQLVVWMGLESEGLGASLQHYNPLIDDLVREQWNLPSTWDLVAQMPFGLPTAQPGEKTFQPMEERFRVFS